LAYDVVAEAVAYQDCGYLVIQVGLESKNVNEAIKIILNEFDKLKRQQISLAELKKNQEFLKGKITLSAEDSFFLAELIGEQELLQNKTKDLKQIFTEIDRISLSDIRNVASQLFRDKNLNLAIIGQDIHESQIKKILKL